MEKGIRKLPADSFLALFRLCWPGRWLGLVGSLYRRLAGGSGGGENAVDEFQRISGEQMIEALSEATEATPIEAEITARVQIRILGQPRERKHD